MLDLDEIVSKIMSRAADGVPLERAIVDEAVDNKLGAGGVQALTHSVNKLRVWQALSKEASPMVKPVKMMQVINEIKKTMNHNTKVAAALDKEVDRHSFITQNVQNFLASDADIQKTVDRKAEEHRALVGRTINAEALKTASEIKNALKEEVFGFNEAIKEFGHLVRARVYTNKTAGALISAINEKGGDIGPVLVKVAEGNLPIHVKAGSPGLEDGEMINWKDPLPAQLLEITERYDRIKALRGKLQLIKDKVK